VASSFNTSVLFFFVFFAYCFCSSYIFHLHACVDCENRVIL
jgi:hypothetical protein